MVGVGIGRGCIVVEGSEVARFVLRRVEVTSIGIGSIMTSERFWVAMVLEWSTFVGSTVEKLGLIVQDRRPVIQVEAGAEAVMEVLVAEVADRPDMAGRVVEMGHTWVEFQGGGGLGRHHGESWAFPCIEEFVSGV